MTWTIEALNREHPLPEGWGWELWENGDTSKYPVAQRPDGTYCAQLYGERLVAVDSSGEYRGEFAGFMHVGKSLVPRYRTIETWSCPDGRRFER